MFVFCTKKRQSSQFVISSIREIEGRLLEKIIFLNYHREISIFLLTLRKKHSILTTVLQPHESAIEIPRDSFFKVIDKGNTLRP